MRNISIHWLPGAWAFSVAVFLLLLYLTTHGLPKFRCGIVSAPTKHTTRVEFSHGQGVVDNLAFPPTPWDPADSDLHVIVDVTARHSLPGRLFISVMDDENAPFRFFSATNNNQNTCALPTATPIPPRHPVQERCDWSVSVNSRVQVKAWGRYLFTPAWLKETTLALSYQAPESEIERIKVWAISTTFPYADTVWRSLFWICFGLWGILAVESLGFSIKDLLWLIQKIKSIRIWG